MIHCYTETELVLAVGVLLPLSVFVSTDLHVPIYSLTNYSGRAV